MINKFQVTCYLYKKNILKNVWVSKINRAGITSSIVSSNHFFFHLFVKCIDFATLWLILLHFCGLILKDLVLIQNIVDWTNINSTTSEINNNIQTILVAIIITIFNTSWQFVANSVDSLIYSWHNYCQYFNAYMKTYTVKLLFT